MSLLLRPMNLVDLFALIPFYVTIVLDKMDDIIIIGKAGKALRLVRVLRILRIFKLFRHFAGLQSLIHTMFEAYKELGLLMLLVFFATFIFAILQYYSEKYGEDPCALLDCALWSIMTISTVGSTSANQPSTLLGQIFGGICPLFGVFIQSLPIPIVVNSFVNCYRNRIWRAALRQRKEENLKERRE